MSERDKPLTDEEAHQLFDEAAAEARAMTPEQRKAYREKLRQEVPGIDDVMANLGKALGMSIQDGDQVQAAGLAVTEGDAGTVAIPNKCELLGLYLLSQWFPGRCYLERFYPPAQLSDDELEEFKTRLNACMPLESLMVDLWEWDIHFEDDLDNGWYFETVFGEPESAQACAEQLAEFFLEKVDEYAMDYDQNANDDFEAMILDEALKFVTSWRQRVVERYAQHGASPVAPQVA